MTVREAIEQLSTMPPGANIMVASMGSGGSVSVEKFELVDDTLVDVVFTEEY